MIHLGMRNALLSIVLLVCLAGCTKNRRPSSAPATAYDVVLAEYSVATADSLTAGNVVFHVTNQGLEDHNLAVFGNGVHQSFTVNLHPDEERDLRVYLPKGQYELYCPIGHHAEKGMHVWVDAK